MSGTYEARRFGGGVFAGGTAVIEGAAATGAAGMLGGETIRVNSLGPVTGVGAGETAGRENAPVANPSEGSCEAIGAADEKRSFDNGSSFRSIWVNSLGG